MCELKLILYTFYAHTEYIDNIEIGKIKLEIRTDYVFDQVYLIIALYRYI